MKYGLQFKMMIGFTIVFFALGVFFELSGFYNSTNLGLSGMYLALSGMYVYQLVLTTAVSKFVKSSPMKYKILTSGPVIISYICLLFTFTVFILLRVLYTINYKGANDTPEQNALMFMGIPMAAALVFVIFVYFGFCYRQYILSTVVMALIVMPGILCGMFKPVENWEISMYNSLVNGFGTVTAHIILYVISYGLITLGAVLCDVINRLTYKTELSEIAYRNAMRQAASAK